jgi:hypothetical protein
MTNAMTSNAMKIRGKAISRKTNKTYGNILDFSK